MKKHSFPPSRSRIHNVYFFVFFLLLFFLYFFFRCPLRSLGLFPRHSLAFSLLFFFFLFFFTLPAAVHSTVCHAKRFTPEDRLALSSRFRIIGSCCSRLVRNFILRRTIRQRARRTTLVNDVSVIVLLSVYSPLRTIYLVVSEYRSVHVTVFRRYFRKYFFFLFHDSATSSPKPINAGVPQRGGHRSPAV